VSLKGVTFFYASVTCMTSHLICFHALTQYFAMYGPFYVNQTNPCPI